MNFFRKFNSNKNIPAFFLTSTLSLMIFFYNDGDYALKIKSFIFNFYESVNSIAAYIKALFQWV